MDDGLIVVLPDGARVVFVGDVDAATDGDGGLTVYEPNYKGRGLRLGGFHNGGWAFWYLGAHAEHIEPDRELPEIHDPKGLLRTRDEINALPEGE